MMFSSKPGGAFSKCHSNNETYHVEVYLSLNGVVDSPFPSEYGYS